VGAEKKTSIERDFIMYDEDFEYLRKLAYEFTGIVLADHKKDMVYSRLARRLRVLGLETFTQYCQVLEKDDPNEHSEFINAITTNLTAFFREGHHFEYMRTVVIPELMKKHPGAYKLRIWSCASSTGEEPYSIAITVKESNVPRNWDVKILATDLDSNVLQRGKDAIYGYDRVEGIGEDRIKKFFLHDKSGHANRVMVKPAIREMIAFKRLNLLESWPMKMSYDIVFCRNVVIYFNKETQRKLFDHIANIMPVGGYLFIGHSESLTNICDRFELVGRTIYRKVH
jgi:chemotaxis protein methyltransferase CheR